MGVINSAHAVMCVISSARQVMCVINNGSSSDVCHQQWLVKWCVSSTIHVQWCLSSTVHVKWFVYSAVCHQQCTPSDVCHQQWYVHVPTDKRSHILDWVVVRTENSCFCFDSVQDYPDLSDHKAVVCTLAVTKPFPRRRLVTSRNIKAICLSGFQSDVRAWVEAASQQCSDLDLASLVDVYNDGLRRVLDRHAPSVTRRVRDRPSAPWMTEEIREARRRRRLAERRWRATRLTVHREIYAKERAFVKACVQEAKRRFYCEKTDSSSSCSLLSAVSSELLGKSSTDPLPLDIPRSDLPDRFCDFFSDKIDRIRDDMDSRSCEPPTFAIFDGPHLSQSEPVTDELIRELILKSPTKSCMLDPIPISLTKQRLDDLVSLIMFIVNASLSTGIVPPQFKQAIVTPLLKKPGLDINDMKNFRPVSNLSFISKILEKVVLIQLKKHLSGNNLLEIFQSAYRQNHSTEKAALRSSRATRETSLSSALPSLVCLVVRFRD